MQRDCLPQRDADERNRPDEAGHRAFRGCYNIQILIVGREKQWRDSMSAEMRRAGFHATTVDSAVDALTVLVLGLPVDVLLTDVDLDDELGPASLASEARALRPNLSIVLASEPADEDVEPKLDAQVLLQRDDCQGLTTIVREALESRLA